MFAVTERLLLRPGWAEDAPALTRAIADWRVVRNLGRVPWPYALVDAQRFLALPHDPLRPNFLAFLRDGGGLVGGIGLHDDAAELGYWVARRHWGRGLATEAGRAVIALADHSLRLPRLLAVHASDNPASGRVLRKLGFAPGGGRTQRQSLGRGEAMEVEAYARDNAAPAAGAGAQLAA